MMRLSVHLIQWGSRKAPLQTVAARGLVNVAMVSQGYSIVCVGMFVR